MGMNKLFSVFGLCLILCFFPKGDTIIKRTLVKGKEQETTLKDIVIEKETFREIKCSYQGGTMTIVPADVIKIIRDKSTEYASAERSYASGKYKEALTHYTRAKSNNDWAYQHCLFYIGECYRRESQHADAIKSYEDLLEKFSETVHIPQVYFCLAECHSSKQKPNWEQAYYYYNQAANIAVEMKQIQDRLRAIYGMASIQEKQNRISEARQHYEEIILYGKEHPNWLFRAKIKKSFCLLKQKQEEEAKKNLMELLDEVPVTNRNVLGGIYLGLGDYWMAKDAKKGLLCYLRVLLQYRDEEEYTVAAYRKAAICLDTLKERYIFSIEIQYQGDLSKQTIPENIRNIFQEKSFSLEKTDTIKLKKQNNNWLIIDNNQQIKYSIIKQGNELKIYQQNIEYKLRAEQLRRELQQQYPQWKH